MIPHITEGDIEAVVSVLRSGMLIQGKQVQLLEQTISELVGSDYAMAASNGTSTMHMALVALGIKEGDEVIVPAFSYVATANVVELVGAVPIFVDIELSTFNINVSKIEQVITSKTKAIIPVHEFGLACNISDIMSLANKYNLAVIEDAACALGATEAGKKIGSFGKFASFSFHPRKSITSGEGGILTTSEKALANKIRILRNHGIDPENEGMEFIDAGFNYRMTDVQAAMLNSQIARLSKIIEHKNELASVYFQELDKDLVQLPTVPEGKHHTWQTYHIVVKDVNDRKALITDLKSRGIGTNYGAQCIPATKYYSSKYNLDSKNKFEYSYIAYTKGLAVPMYFGLSKEDVRMIAKEINKSLKNGF